MHKPANRRQLWSFVGAHLGVWLPWQAFTPGHSTPLDFVAEAFFRPEADVAAWANRSGIKTLGASVLAAVEFFFQPPENPLQARVLAGSEAQAGALYEYWMRWCGTLLAGKVRRGPTRRVTDLDSGRMEILAASQKRVRGPKVQRLFEDELDEIDSDVDTAAAGMIATRAACPARTVYTSTWHRVDGPMAALVEGADGRGVRLHKWNLWESLERCPRGRHDDGRGCAVCALGPPCLAKARQYHGRQDWPVGIAAQACGLYRVDEAVKAYRKVSAATWQAEYLCERPSVEGLVFPEFDPAVHACPAPPAELTVYRAIDWGADVFVCLWVGVDGEGRSYVLDTYCAEGGTLAAHAERIAAHRLREVQATYCDPAGASRNDQTGLSNVQQFARWGIRCTYTTSPRLRDVRNGIGMVRAALAPADGRPRLFYAAGEGNRMFVKAMQSYRNRKVNGIWTDEPADPQEFEHVPDALRYFFVNRSGPRDVRIVGYGAA
ncbi:MAG: hypothetical protein NT031_11130 [Planctomycetota bacterium]|nr:hypothetical protein [Planctomycetota bacterium]